eukprot:PhF_6_TR29163/c2_g1_i2/m.42635
MNLYPSETYELPGNEGTTLEVRFGPNLLGTKQVSKQIYLVNASDEKIIWSLVAVKQDCDSVFPCTFVPRGTIDPQSTCPIEIAVIPSNPTSDAQIVPLLLCFEHSGKKREIPVHVSCHVVLPELQCVDDITFGNVLPGVHTVSIDVINPTPLPLHIKCQIQTVSTAQFKISQSKFTIKPESRRTLDITATFLDKRKGPIETELLFGIHSEMHIHRIPIRGNIIAPALIVRDKLNDIVQRHASIPPIYVTPGSVERTHVKIENACEASYVVVVESSSSTLQIIPNHFKMEPKSTQIVELLYTGQTAPMKEKIECHLFVERSEYSFTWEVPCSTQNVDVDCDLKTNAENEFGVVDLVCRNRGDFPLSLELEDSTDHCTLAP